MGSILVRKEVSFTFVVLVIATIVVGILFCIIVYVWIADYMIKEVKQIVRILNTKKIRRKRSVHELPERTTKAAYSFAFEEYWHKDDCISISFSSLIYSDSDNPYK